MFIWTLKADLSLSSFLLFIRTFKRSPSNGSDRGLCIHSVPTQSFKSTWSASIQLQQCYSLFSIKFPLSLSLLSCGGSIVTKRGTLSQKHIEDEDLTIHIRFRSTFKYILEDRMWTVDLVHHLGLQASSNEQEEWLQKEKLFSLFIWVPGCFKIHLSLDTIYER